MTRRPPKPTLFPTTTLSRSPRHGGEQDHSDEGPRPGAPTVGKPQSARRHHGKQLEAQLADAGSIAGVASLRQRERSEEHTSELQSQSNLVCRLLLEKKTSILRELPQQFPRSHRINSLRNVHRVIITVSYLAHLYMIIHWKWSKDPLLAQAHVWEMWT